MRVAITGATGNLGTALIRALRRHDPASDIIGICRRPPEESLGGVDWRRIDFSGPEADPALTAAFDGVEAVVHLAWAIQPARATEWQHRVNVADDLLDGFATAAQGPTPALQK
ncbi:MAG TPA: NAD-dependent epimerase/dehydratase family protein [Sporichthya sp.]|nr:NAD-dependent epimerase/dehydratase family protein [Sporichthya sp.]